MSPSSDSPRRVLLVEFLDTDRYSQYRSEMYPFVRGFAEALGDAVRWLAFGFDREKLPDGPYRVTLPADEEAALLAAVREFAPTHVLLNEELHGPLDGRLRAAAGTARVDIYLVGGGPSFARQPALEWWLGHAAAPERTSAAEEAFLRSPFLVDVVTPSYDCELVGPLARAIRPLTFVLGGPHCLYAAPLGRNPHYDGVDLSRAHRASGCAFCGEGEAGRYPHATGPVPLALKQIRAARATLPAERASGHFALWGAAAALRVDAVFEALLEESAPPTHLYVAFRIDELRRLAPRLETLLPRLIAAGHALHVYNMGVENFSAVENERLNKGIDAADVDDAIALIERWERTWPDAFDFSRTGGFGYILFTPWTTPADLRVNLAAAERIGVLPSSFFFVSRIQLLPGRPLTLLAERDGLLADAFDAAAVAAFDSGCLVSSEQQELPWRFQVPAIAPVYALAFHLRELLYRGATPASPDGQGGDARRVADLLSRLPDDARSPYRILPAALDAADEAPDERTLADLLPRVEARLGDIVRPAAGPGPSELERTVRAVLHLIERQPKPLLAGFTVRSVVATAPEDAVAEVFATLVRGDETLRLSIRDRDDPAARGYRVTPHHVVSHDSATPVDTPDKERAIDVFARALARYVDARGPIARGSNAR